jgi:hypothetical protein
MMKKITLLVIVLFVSLSLYSQSIYKGLEYGMTEDQAKDEFKSNKDTYKTVDLGNNFLYRIYRQNFVFEKTSLVGVLFTPKGTALGMSYDSAKNYLIHTRGFFEDLGYQTFIDNEWWDAPLNYVSSGSKWGLVLTKPDKSIVVQFYPDSYELYGNTVYMVKLMIWNHDTWMGYYDKENKNQSNKVEDSGF